MALTFTSENFDAEVLKSESPVLIDFYADWCAPCKVMGVILDEIAGIYEGRAKVGKINIDDNELIAAKYNVMTIPTLLVIKNGEVADKFIGVTNRAVISAAIDKVL